MTENTDLDFTKHHVILGEGPGRDLIVQGGKYYTSWGKQIAPTKEAIEENGIRWTREIMVHIQKHTLQIKADAERAKLEEMLRKIDEEETARIKSGLPVSFEEEETELPEPLDFSSLDELEAIVEETPKVRSKTKR